MLGISTGRPKGFIGLVSHEPVDIASIGGAGLREHETALITTADKRIKNARMRIPGVSLIKRPNALVQLQAHLTMRAQRAIQKCLSAATFVRQAAT
jgi:hypothetical protein